MRAQDAPASHCNRAPIGAGCDGSFPQNSANYMESKATIAELNHVAKLSASELGAGCGDGRRTSEPEHLRRRRKIARRAGHGGSYKLKKLYLFRL